LNLWNYESTPGWIFKSKEPQGQKRKFTIVSLSLLPQSATNYPTPLFLQYYTFESELPQLLLHTFSRNHSTHANARIMI
jgi:hypothetical protein